MHAIDAVALFAAIVIVANGKSSPKADTAKGEFFVSGNRQLSDSASFSNEDKKRP